MEITLNRKEMFIAIKDYLTKNNLSFQNPIMIINIEHNKNDKEYIPSITIKENNNETLA